MIPALSSAIGALDPSEWTIPPLNAPAAPGSSSGGFSDALTNAIGSLEQTQAKGTAASQALATGQLSDPTQAVTAVENAALAMDLASQIRTKLVEAVNTVFQTQA